MVLDCRRKRILNDEEQQQQPTTAQKKRRNRRITGNIPFSCTHWPWMPRIAHSVISLRERKQAAIVRGRVRCAPIPSISPAASTRRSNRSRHHNDEEGWVSTFPNVRWSLRSIYNDVVPDSTYRYTFSTDYRELQPNETPIVVVGSIL